jgi:shikimate kinase
MLEKSIILVGAMGSGKSTIGRKLALSLGVPFFDSDDEIVTQDGMSMVDIFSQKGESYSCFCD